MSSSNPKGGIKNVPPPDGGTRQSTYGRFIPREEINSFEAWAPKNIGGNKPAQGVSRQPSKPEASSKTLTPAEELAQALLKARQEGFREGYADGIAGLDNFKREYAAEVSGQLGAVIESLMAQLEDLQQDMARSLAVCAGRLAKQAVRSELQTRPELVVQVANEALESLLLSARHITLHVHPEDFALISEGAADLLNAREVRMVSDTSITRGGCMVESDIGMIDATIETRWRRALASIGCDSEWDESYRAEGTHAHPDAAESARPGKSLDEEGLE